VAEYDVKTAIPQENFKATHLFGASPLSNPNSLVVGDPYIEFTKDNKNYNTRNFNHSEIVPKKGLIYGEYAKLATNYSSQTAWESTSAKSFIIPLMEKFTSSNTNRDGKLVGYVRGYISTNMDNGHNVLNISNIQIAHGGYGKTFAEGQKDAGLKVNIGRNILSQVIQKLPFIDEVKGYRVSGARRVAETEAVEKQSWFSKLLKKPIKEINKNALIKPEMISKIKNNLASKGLIDSFFTQAKLSTDNVKEWLTKNNRAVAGVAMSGNDPMQSLGVKSMGNALDDPANFYLKMAEGGFVEGDEFSDMIEFMPSTMMNDGGIVGIDHLTRRL